MNGGRRLSQAEAFRRTEHGADQVAVGRPAAAPAERAGQGPHGDAGFDAGDVDQPSERATGDPDDRFRALDVAAEPEEVVGDPAGKIAAAAAEGGGGERGG